MNQIQGSILEVIQKRCETPPVPGFQRWCPKTPSFRFCRRLSRAKARWPSESWQLKNGAILLEMIGFASQLS